MMYTKNIFIFFLISFAVRSSCMELALKSGATYYQCNPRLRPRDARVFAQKRIDLEKTHKWLSKILDPVALEKSSKDLFELSFAYSASPSFLNKIPTEDHVDAEKIDHLNELRRVVFLFFTQRTCSESSQKAINRDGK